MIMTNHDPRACTARSSCDERLGRADVHKERSKLRTLPPKNVRIRFRMSVICRDVLNFDLATPAALG